MDNKERHLEKLFDKELLKRISPIWVCLVAYFLYSNIPDLLGMLAYAAGHWGILATGGLTILSVCLVALVCLLLVLVAAAFSSFTTIFWPLPSELEEYLRR